MTTSGDGEALAEVRLLGVPLDAYRTAAEHHDELNREFALMASATGVHDVPARLVALGAEVRARFGGFTAEQEAQIQAALDRGDASIDLTYRVPPEAATAAEELDALFDEADDYCAASGELLTLAATPSVRAFRQWFLREFALQLRGAPPTPWPGMRDAAEPR